MGVHRGARYSDQPYTKKNMYKKKGREEDGGNEWDAHVTYIRW